MIATCTSTTCAEPRRRGSTSPAPDRVIAEILAWEEEQVERIIRRYVDRAAATKALIRQLNEKRT